MNNIMITGNVSAVELKDANGKKYAHFSITHGTRKADGSYSRGYLDLTAFSPLAERIAKFTKGSPIEVMAHFSFSSYTDKDGKTKYSHNIVVDSFARAGNGAFLGKKETEEETKAE